jgi:arsenate reductase (glutaredoxin)
MLLYYKFNSIARRFYEGQWPIYYIFWAAKAPKLRHNAAMTIVYGIPNCETVKKALAWLDEHRVKYDFHNFKTDGLDAATVNAWMNAIGWEPLVNRKGTTWRRLDTSMQLGVRDANSARALMLANLSVIKRPVVQWGKAVNQDSLTVGFDEEAFGKRKK